MPPLTAGGVLKAILIGLSVATGPHSPVHPFRLKEEQLAAERTSTAEGCFTPMRAYPSRGSWRASLNGASPSRLLPSGFCAFDRDE